MAELVKDHRGEHLTSYDKRDGVRRPEPGGQDYRGGDVEGAEQPSDLYPPWCAGDVGEHRNARADQKHRRPEDKRAHEEGDRRGCYRPSDRSTQFAVDGELYRYRGPRQNGEQQKQSLCLSFSFPYHSSPRVALLEEPVSPKK